MLRGMVSMEDQKKESIRKEEEVSHKIDSIQQRANELAAETKQLRKTVEKEEAELNSDSVPASEKPR